VGVRVRVRVAVGLRRGRRLGLVLVLGGVLCEELAAGRPGWQGLVGLRPDLCCACAVMCTAMVWQSAASTQPGRRAPLACLLPAAAQPPIHWPLHTRPHLPRRPALLSLAVWRAARWPRALILTGTTGAAW